MLDNNSSPTEQMKTRPHLPAKLHIANVTTGLNLTASLTAPVSPTTPHSEAESQRCMSSVSAWSPILNRRQSWDLQEHKHELHMLEIRHVQTGPGFTERELDTEFQSERQYPESNAKA